MVLSSIILMICSLLLTLQVRHYAIRNSIYDVPNERSSHFIPTPRGGGIAIVVCFTVAMMFLEYTSRIPVNLYMALVGGGFAIAALGFWDDLYGMSSFTRLCAHFLIAFWAVYWLGGFSVLDFGTFKFVLKSRGSLLAVVAIVWLINLYNFMDGIDGLAASEGIFTALSAALALWLLQFPLYSQIMLLLAAAILGFALLNWPPAKIFLGDVGSGYLGYIFAVFGIAMAKENILPVSFWLIILGIFVCDATFTVVSRAWHAKRIHTAHREHAYQHMHIYGATHKQIVVTITFINVCILMPIAFMVLARPYQAFWYLSGILVTLLCAWIAIKRLPLHAEATT